MSGVAKTAHRICTMCELSKPNEEFYYDIRSDSYRPDCKDCRKAFERWKYKNNPSYAEMHRAKDQYKRDHRLGRYAVVQRASRAQIEK